MFEKEIQTAKQQLSSHLLTGETYVYLQEILAGTDIHGFYKAFFRGEVDWWIYEQKMLREANPRFNVADEQFNAVLQEFDAQCKRTARFDHPDLTALIDLAVKTRVNYLLRPRTTLKWFVYRGEPTRPLREVLLRLAYFDCYRYLIDEFMRWADGKLGESSQQDILSVIEFERLIEHIDNEIILEHTTSEFAGLLEPLYEFFSEVQPDDRRDVIPTPALIIFLDDKGILRISQELERLMKEDDLDMISREQFLRVIDSVITQVEDETHQQDYVDVTTIPLDFDHSTGKKSDTPAAAEAPAPQSAPLVAEGNNSGEAKPPVDVAPPGDVAPPADAASPAVDLPEPATTPEIHSAAEHEEVADMGAAPEGELIPEPDTAAEVMVHETEETPAGLAPSAGELPQEPQSEEPGSTTVVLPPYEAAGLSRALADLALASAAFNRPDTDEPSGVHEPEATADEIASLAAVEKVPAVEEVDVPEAEEIVGEVEELPVSATAVPENPQTEESAAEEPDAAAHDDNSAQVEISVPDDEPVDIQPSSETGVHGTEAEFTVEAFPAGAELHGVEPAADVPETLGSQEQHTPAQPEDAQEEAESAGEENEPVVYPEVVEEPQESAPDVPAQPEDAQEEAESAGEENESAVYPEVAQEPQTSAPDVPAQPEDAQEEAESAGEENESVVYPEVAQEPQTSAPDVPDAERQEPEAVQHTAPAEERSAAELVFVEPEVVPVIEAAPVEEQGPSLRSMHDLLDDSMRQRVLKHVFHRNEARFDAVLERLNATRSWREASAIIDRVFSEHEVDPYSSIARKFSDIVYERFLG